MRFDAFWSWIWYTEKLKTNFDLYLRRLIEIVYSVWYLLGFTFVVYVYKCIGLYMTPPCDSQNSQTHRLNEEEIVPENFNKICNARTHSYNFLKLVLTSPLVWLNGSIFDCTSLRTISVESKIIFTSSTLWHSLTLHSC